MQDAAQFDGSIPAIYDEALGPLLFHWTSARLGELVRVGVGGRVLEVACGTGISTEGLRVSLPLDVEIVATDLNEAMLAEATSRRGAMPNVSFRIADAQHLPFEDGSFDAVVCQFGLMFFPDKVAALREALRVLRPEGQLVFSVWDSLDRNPPVRAVHETFAELFPEDPPRFLETPFGLYDNDVLRGLFRAAGATEIEIETREALVELSSAREPALGLVCGNPAAREIEARDGPSIEEVVDAAEAALARGFGADPVRAPLSAIYVSARAA